ncbi:protein lin-52 homolog isoform X1 [Ursus arctos]|uniref:protein lin-52 homolog isoform X1 n=1 Tax=Ursus arctos TaxID=9644 RepID=UPI0020175E11|nr:protein lin-52 homolog isoform X1 [Ursus arctos]
MGWKMASPTDGTDLEASLLSFEKLDRASPDLWPEQLPGVAEFAASFKSPITSSPPKWMAEIERDDIDMLKELGSLTTANLMEKVRGLQNLAYQLGLDESQEGRVAGRGKGRSRLPAEQGAGCGTRFQDPRIMT